MNVFGVQRVNRAALPILREQGSGLLVHISSLLGRFVLPFLGPYNASKHALEALADNYRVELGAVGIDSVRTAIPDADHLFVRPDSVDHATDAIRGFLRTVL